MDGQTVPYVIASGYEFRSYGDGDWANCLGIACDGYKQEPQQRFVVSVGLGYWDEQHAVVELVGPGLRRRQRLAEISPSSIYYLAALDRQRYDKLIVRYVATEIVEILSARPGKAATFKVIVEEFNARHEPHNGFGLKDEEATLQHGHCTVVVGPLARLSCNVLITTA